MGNTCGSGANHSQFNFKYFLNKYGRETMLNVTKDNVRKEEIQKKMPQIIEKYRSSIHQAKISSVRDLNFTQASIIQDIQHKIKEIQKSDTGQVHKAEQKFDKPAQDLLGRNEIQKDCNNLRQKIIEAYEAEQKKTKQIIETQFQAYLSTLEKERKQQFVEIQQLTPENRQAIRKEARDKFKSEIKSYRKEVARQIEEGKVVDVVHLKSDYSHLHPKEEIEKIKSKAKELIDAGEDKIAGRFFKAQSEMKSEAVLAQGGFWKCC